MVGKRLSTFLFGLVYVSHMIIVAFRHGQTDYNVAQRLQGQRLNAALNKRGIDEVREGVAIALAEHGSPFESLYSSPLLRARQTGDIISQHINLPVTVVSEIIENDFGSLTGSTWDEIGQKYRADLKTKHDKIEFNYRPYGGESVEQVMVRVNRFLDMIEKRDSGNVLLATHGGVIRVIYKILQLSQPDHIANGSAHMFDLNKKVSGA